MNTRYSFLNTEMLRIECTLSIARLEIDIFYTEMIPIPALVGMIVWDALINLGSGFGIFENREMIEVPLSPKPLPF